MRSNKDKPFFLYLPFIIPHLSIQAPKESVDAYTSAIPEADHEHRGYLKHPTPRAGYAAMVTHMDKGIGEVTSLIDELGLGEDTLIIFTSDNGPTYDRLGGSDSDFFQSSGEYRGRKGSVYEGGIRVPMVARWKGHTKTGIATDHISAFWDLLATISDAADAETPKDTDGISFLPTITGKGDQSKHEYLLWEFPSYKGQQAVRMGKWKAVRANIFQGNRELELYDLEADPSESKNVAAEHPNIVKRVEEILVEGRTDSELFPIFRPRPKKQKQPGKKAA